MKIPALDVWRLYRGRADCENRIKELKADFGLDSFVLSDFWATEAALGGVLAVGALWNDYVSNCIKPAFRLAVTRKRRPWFESLWANAGEPVKLTPGAKNS